MRLVCEHRVATLAVDRPHPRLSWIPDEKPAGPWQVAVHRGDDLLWQSEPLATDTCHVDLPIDLDPLTRYGWSVGDAHSEFTTGFLGSWQADWLSVDLPPSVDEPLLAFQLVRRFHLDPVPAHCLLHLAARGVAAAWINGVRVPGGELMPGWSATTRRRYYETIDVSDLLQAGDNEMVLEIAEGWACGRLGWADDAAHMRRIWEPQPSVRVQLESDTGTVLDTSGDWLARRGPVVAAGIYDGETWDLSSPCDELVLVRLPDDGVLCTALPCAGIRQIVTMPPLVRTSIEGGELLDFGQNAAGIVELETDADVVVRHGEMLDADGRLYTENLRTARATATLRGVAERTTFRPRHTFMGFRYAEIQGRYEVGSARFQVLSSAACDGLTFSCSDSRLERLVENTRWGLRSNLLSVPTDCPQRDERLGWTGDALAIAPTACLYGDAWPVFAKWLGDLADGQRDDGALPDVAPDALTIIQSRGAGNPEQFMAHDAWGDAGVFVSWTLYQHTGDERLLATHWDMMVRWLDWRRTVFDADAGDIRGYGDWLAPDAPSPGEAPTSRSFIRQAFSIRCADILAAAADLLGRDASPFREQAATWRVRFAEEWVDTNGRLTVQTQTASVLALGFGLVDNRDGVAEDLVAQIGAADGHLRTGFVGTPLLLPVLSGIGRNDLAWQVLMQEDHPGWLFALRGDATTTWERWDSYDPDKGFSATGMNSFNHYAYGCVTEWIIGHALGLRATAPGWKSVVFDPQPGGGVSAMSASVETPMGRVSATWWMEDGALKTDLTLPAGMTLVPRG